jgi:hypothetical protein
MLELLRSGNGVGWAASSCLWREPHAKAKEARPTRRLGETRRTRLELDDQLGVPMSTIVQRLYHTHRIAQGVGLDLEVPH